MKYNLVFIKFFRQNDFRLVDYNGKEVITAIKSYNLQNKSLGYFEVPSGIKFNSYRSAYEYAIIWCRNNCREFAYL